MENDRENSFAREASAPARPARPTGGHGRTGGESAYYRARCNPIPSASVDVIRLEIGGTYPRRRMVRSRLDRLIFRRADPAVEPSEDHVPQRRGRRAPRSHDPHRPRWGAASWTDLTLFAPFERDSVLSASVQTGSCPSTGSGAIPSCPASRCPRHQRPRGTPQGHTRGASGFSLAP